MSQAEYKRHYISSRSFILFISEYLKLVDILLSLILMRSRLLDTRSDRRLCLLEALTQRCQLDDISIKTNHF